MQTGRSKERCLLVTMTNEPFQPVRLYYAVPDAWLVTRKLEALRCVVEAPIERCRQWLYHAVETIFRKRGDPIAASAIVSGRGQDVAVRIQ